MKLVNTLMNCNELKNMNNQSNYSIDDNHHENVVTNSNYSHIHHSTEGIHDVSLVSTTNLDTDNHDHHDQQQLEHHDYSIDIIDQYSDTSRIRLDSSGINSIDTGLTSNDNDDSIAPPQPPPPPCSTTMLTNTTSMTSLIDESLYDDTLLCSQYHHSSYESSSASLHGAIDSKALKSDIDLNISLVSLSSSSSSSFLPSSTTTTVSSPSSSTLPSSAQILSSSAAAQPKSISPFLSSSVKSPSSPLPSSTSSSSSTASAPASPYSSSIQLPKSQYFTCNQPNDLTCQYYQSAIQSIFKYIEPNEKQIEYHLSILAFIRKHSRICLNANIFSSSLSLINCSLPDDIINITIIIPKSLILTWHLIFIERLNLIIDRMLHTYQLDVTNNEENEIIENLFNDDLYIRIRHEINNIKCIKNINYGSMCIQGTIDNNNFNIQANNKNDILFLLFLEDVNNLINKNDLFKKSLLLIRAWWIYETTSYVGTSISQYLSDYSIIIMICAIFNQYHEFINYPLQTLCLFLTEYSNYDSTNNAITIQGIVPFKSTGASVTATAATAQTTLLSSASLPTNNNNENDNTTYTTATTTTTASNTHFNSTNKSTNNSSNISSNQPQLLLPNKNHLFKLEFLEKYWHLYNLNNSQVDSHDFEFYLQTITPPILFYDESHSNNNDDTNDDDNVIINNKRSSTSRNDNNNNKSNKNNNQQHHDINFDSGIRNLFGIASNTLTYFDRHSYNIVHPFTHCNMVTEKLSTRRLMRLHKAFQIGAHEISIYMKSHSDITNAATTRNTTTTTTSSTAAASTSATINADTTIVAVTTTDSSTTRTITANATTTVATTTAATITKDSAFHCNDILNYFPVIITRFSDPWRRDAINHTTPYQFNHEM